MAEEQRRSARHLLGSTAEVHFGPRTIIAVVRDVSRHGMGLAVPTDLEVAVGDLVWILVESVASYAITGTVRRLGDDGLVGVELDEILEGTALEHVESLPLLDGEGTADIITEPR